MPALLAACILGANRASAADALAPVRVQVVQHDGKWQLLRDGKAYFIKGAGGDGTKALLAECGGNSLRTWGIGADTRKDLDEAQRLGLTVSVGIWLGHKDQGFRYDDSQAVQKQFDDVKRAVLEYKDHPAVLAWSLGNEMELDNDTPALWKAVQDLAHMVHEVDPLHPTMTVVAEIGGDKVRHIHQYCPDIDIIGINSYGGGPSLAERYRKAGGVKPFVITEFGQPGTWEVHPTAFGAAPELTSTAKAEFYRNTYTKSVLGAPDLCLGSYAFIWGHKVEATATWYGMFLPDGSRLAAGDAMQELWSGKPPAHPCPVMKKLTLDGKDQVSAGDSVTANVETGDAGDETLKIEWALLGEQGHGSDPAPSYPEAIETNGGPQVSLKMPRSGGVYRLYCYVRDAHGGAAVGSVPIKVIGPVAPIKAAVADLPLVVYAEGRKGTPFVASGWMGNVQAIKMDFDCTDHPHAGKTCLKVTYKVKFGYGLIGIDKKYHDSSRGEIEVTLTSEWKHYTIDLSEKELTRIKSGFIWTVGGQGKPLTFYLDDVEYK